MPPASAIATLVAALMARFHSAPAACSLASSLPSRTSSTSGTMPPASAIAALASLMARHFSAPPRRGALAATAHQLDQRRDAARLRDRDLLAALTARFTRSRRLLHARPRCPRTSSISGVMAPASAIATLLAALTARRWRPAARLGALAAAARQLDQRRDAARLRDRRLVGGVDGQVPQRSRRLLGDRAAAAHQLNQRRDGARLRDRHLVGVDGQALQRPAAPTLAPSLPPRASSISGAMPPSAIATLLAALTARFHSAPAACSLAPSLPLRAGSISGAWARLDRRRVGVVDGQVPQRPRRLLRHPTDARAQRRDGRADCGASAMFREARRVGAVTNAEKGERTGRAHDLRYYGDPPGAGGRASLASPSAAPPPP